MPTDRPISRRSALKTAAGLSLAASLLPEGARADEPEDPRMLTTEVVAFEGWAKNYRIANADAELIVTLEVGPRIISYKTAGGENVFKLYDDQLGKAGEDQWMIRGGHRLWAGPEDLTRTYAPDNGPVEVSTPEPGLVRFRPEPEPQYGLQKEIDVRLAPEGTLTTVIHRIRNVGPAPTSLAPWGLSVMAPGGVEIIPMPPRKPHPGSPKNAKSATEFLPDRLMVFWPYFDFKDPRWSFGTDFITLRQADQGPTKVGMAHQMGWVGYLNRGTLFVKRFPYEANALYPDQGCNFETFSNEDMLECETLGPITRLDPGAAVEHTEQWELISGLGSIDDEEDIRARIAPKVKG